MKLSEIRPGLFLNVDQIISVRVLAQEEEGAYAVLQMSSGDKMNLSRAEFTAITGDEPHPTGRSQQMPQAK